jgi:hypothetical protein
MTPSRFCIPLLVALAACAGETGETRQPLPEDTGEATVLTIDTADFIPVDTGTEFGTEDVVPLSSLFISQSGIMTVSPAGGPFTDVSGSMLIQEYIDAPPNIKKDPEAEYACEATYSLTGQAPADHSCGSCDFVFDIEFFVSDGDATACREPDTPQHQVVWRMGYDSGQGKILHDYGGTGVWVPWMDANLAGTDLTFSFDKVVAIQVEEEEEE